MNTNFLVKLTARGWALPILAGLHQGVAGRQAALIRQTGAPRSAFLQSLQHLQDLGLVARNPGHGHPLRPEYVLTPAGQTLGPMAGQISARVTGAEAVLLRRAWSLPVLAVAHRPCSFGQIRADLAPVTDRALSQALKALVGQSWVARHVDVAAHPPRPIYQSIGAGAELARLAQAAPLPIGAHQR